jgi:phosphoribosyl-dephospho-CoA transferase
LGKIDNDIKEIANKIGNLVGRKRKHKLDEILRKISSAINTGKNIIGKIRTHINNIITIIKALIELI